MSVQRQSHSPLSTSSKRKRPGRSTLPEATQSTRKRSRAEPAKVPLMAPAELPAPGKAEHVSEVPSSPNSAGDHRCQGRTGIPTEAPCDDSRQAAATKLHDRAVQSRQSDNAPQNAAHIADDRTRLQYSLRDSLSDLAQDATILGFHESALLLARVAAHLASLMHNK